MDYVSDKVCRENQHTRFTFNNFYPELCPLSDNVEKYGTTRQAMDENIIRRMRFAYRVNEERMHKRIPNI
jgi:hypothetical protein